MSRVESWCLHLSTGLVGGTGIAYAIFKYAVRSDDPYAVVGHPWQPALQHLHILVAPLLVFAGGMIWQRHVVGHWRRGDSESRRSGLSLALTLGPLIASGYLIQVATGATFRQVAIVVHLATGGLWIAGYAAHQLAARSARRAALGAAEPAAEPPRQRISTSRT